jgi:2-keto-4-pentenoate hydratase/2-oxohepta-3-ene-1,7-dioic acid hydratase in catechol pathway
MRIVRYRDGDGAAYGVIEDDAVYVLQGDVFGACNIGRRQASLEDVQILAPCLPSKVLAVGRNYVEHAQETQNDVPEEPLIFLKPPTTVVAHLDPIVYPVLSQRVDHEGELAVVIGRRCRCVEPAQARDYVLGYTCANDVTARDLQRKDGQWTRGKGFDTFLPLGPFIQTDFDWVSASVQTRLNGQVRQNGRLKDMVFPVDFLISFVSQVMTLLPGDILLTGTPAGIGPMQPGDVVEVEISGIGTLRNHVVAAKH